MINKKKCQILNYIPHSKSEGIEFRQWVKYYMYELKQLFTIHNEVLKYRYNMDIKDYDNEFKNFVWFIYQNSSQYIPHY